MTRAIVFVALSLSAASCTLGPNYRRPTVAIPSAFRDTGGAAQAGAASLADVRWFDLFKDDTLGQLVRTALVQNFDLQIAAERVLQARALSHRARRPVSGGRRIGGSLARPSRRLARGRCRPDSVRTFPMSRPD